MAVAALGFTVLVPLPQFYKLAKARSSAGVSLFTVIITMFFSMLNVGAALITKWRQITACGHLGWSCVPNLLDLFQNIQVAIIAAIQLVMVVAYPPNAREPWRRPPSARQSSFGLHACAHHWRRLAGSARLPSLPCRGLPAPSLPWCSTLRSFSPRGGTARRARSPSYLTRCKSREAISTSTRASLRAPPHGLSGHHG